MNRTEKRSELPHKDEALPSARAKAFAISDLDIDIGMLNSGGKIYVYRSILLDFCRDTKEKDERLRQAARTGNATLCIILLHALKDESAGIGAIGLARRAMWLADAARNGELADMCERTDTLLKNKRLLIKHIRAALEQAAPRGEGRAIDPPYFCAKAP